ncbi:hypothetical protein baBA2_000545 [Borrelia anserina]|uniref:Myosin family protein n=1 Tax=Borrelia anserina BA2 TaxID=1313293 RepID=W5SMX7_BORAN|nr:hypothetical protein [Borrelia anserina]AHH08529.1 Myosin family protein [Borrelia anserina BA2]UPA06921.1 hypothetical protein baBA2_000545 [Borrelia anserina]
MGKDKKILLMLPKTFMLFLCTLLFGVSKKNTTDHIINYSKIYIPKEDLSEDFNNEEDTNYHKKNAILKSNGQSRNNILTNEELQHTQSPNTKNFYLTEENIDDWLIKSIDNLKIRIEDYEKKIENIENILSHTSIKSLKKKNEEYEFIIKSLKKEIEKIKNLINIKQNLLDNDIQSKNSTYYNNDQEHEANLNGYIENEEYNYPPEENTYDMYPQEQEYFNPENPILSEIYDKINNNKDAINDNIQRLSEIDNKINNNKDAINDNIQRLSEIDDKINNNKDAINDNIQRLSEIYDKINNNKDILLVFQKELINLKNNNTKLKNIENNLSSIDRTIKALKDKIEKNEELYKENKDIIQQNQDKTNILNKRLTDNENNILTIKEEFTKYKNKDNLTHKNREVQYTKQKFYPKNKKTINKNSIIKIAEFKIYPDTHSNNYNFKDQSSSEFDFKKSNGYYIEIEPTKNLYRAKEIYKLIPKYNVKNHFINPSLKHKEAFFRNLIKIEHTNDISTLYKNLSSEFKNIRIIK